MLYTLTKPVSIRVNLAKSIIKLVSVVLNRNWTLLPAVEITRRCQTGQPFSFLSFNLERRRFCGWANRLKRQISVQSTGRTGEESRLRSTWSENRGRGLGSDSRHFFPRLDPTREPGTWREMVGIKRLKDVFGDDCEEIDFGGFIRFLMRFLFSWVCGCGFMA